MVLYNIPYINLAMQHAGVAITVTSVTDVLAFGVGAITVSEDAGVQFN